MLNLWSDKLLLSSTEESLVSIYNGTYTAVNNTTQQTDIAVVNPPQVGDAVGMSWEGQSLLVITQISASALKIKYPSSAEGTLNYKGKVNMGGKEFIWYHTGGYAPVSAFVSPAAIVGDLALINDVGAYNDGYSKITAVGKDTITVSYYATGKKATVQFKENVSNFIYRT